ncbi:acyltransferase [Anaerobiospirillum succiniciproducens]|uniref:acyltransferase n=1 Tax=Anaerobiospirillum succiniciproducens TaxID=13335 RepID=UPI0023531991|nr:acyltransferase [Anaerobiospirillum succiniciproducens]MCI6863078.1 acyltransferase [Anaerobiospirillum succiniciproducens]
MLHFLPAPILFVINFVWLSIGTTLLSIPVLLMAFIKLILPIRPVLKVVDVVNQLAFKCFCLNNAFLIRLTNKADWDIQGFENIKINGSCIIISNHVTWADIVLLCHVYRGRIPITKFFLKQSLIWIPVIGQVCYAIGMPFLRRYSRAKILKNPKLKNKDVNATRKACKSLVNYPSSLVNFVEGTRFTEAKAVAQKTPYQNLMPPKATSLAVALGIIGNNIDCILNTTLVYPDNKPGTNIFMSLLCGRLHKFAARVEVISKEEEIQEHLIGDYLNDKQFKRNFNTKLRAIWQEKDESIAAIKGIDYVPRDIVAATGQDSAAAGPDSAATGQESAAAEPDSAATGQESALVSLEGAAPSSESSQTGVDTQATDVMR